MGIAGLHQLNNCQNLNLLKQINKQTSVGYRPKGDMTPHTYSVKEGFEKVKNCLSKCKDYFNLKEGREGGGWLALNYQIVAMDPFK